MNVHFVCPECTVSARLGAPLPDEWQCPACDHLHRLRPAAEPLDECVICGNREMYRKKDFPHGLGMAILVAACLASVVTYGLYRQWVTWAILIGSALFDGVLYLLVRDVVVCYRCGAHYRGLASASFAPHELTVAERYRQERIRREQFKQGPDERPASAGR